MPGLFLRLEGNIGPRLQGHRRGSFSDMSLKSPFLAVDYVVLRAPCLGCFTSLSPSTFGHWPSGAPAHTAAYPATTMRQPLSGACVCVCTRLHMASCSLDEILSNVISAGGARAPVTSFAQRIQVTGVDAVADHHQCVHSVCMASPKYTKMLLFLLSASVILYGCPALALDSSRFVTSVLAKPECVCFGIPGTGPDHSRHCRSR